MKVQMVSRFPTEMKPIVGIDIETTSLYGTKISDPHRDRIVSIALSDGDNAWVCLDPAGFPSINPILEREDIKKVIHNSNFEWQFMMGQLGSKPNKDSIHDSLLVERVINNGAPIWVQNSLEAVAARRVGVMLNKETRATFAQHEGDLTTEQLEYIVNDVAYLPKIYGMQMQDVSKMRLGKVVRLENRITVPVAEMALRGVCFDQELFEDYQGQIKPALAQLKREMADYLGYGRQLSLFDEQIDIDVNLNSNPQIQKILYQLGIEVEDTREPTLVEFMQAHPKHEHIPFLKMLLDGWRMWAKMDSVDYVKYINPKTGRIHPSWNQIQAETGRFSCSGPNLQNVHQPLPGRPNFRLLFPPPPGYKYIIADYSQQEPRILAQLSEDEAFRRACQESDVYIALGETIYGTRIDKEDRRRNILKTCVLAFFYGSSAEGLATKTGLPKADLEVLQAAVFKLCPRAKGYSSRQKTFARQQGYIRTLLGRVRSMEGIVGMSEGHKDRVAINTPVQGSAADMLKMGLDIYDDIKVERGYDSYVALQIHDELVVAVREDQADEAYYQVIGALEKAGSILCPDVRMIANGKVADQWVKT